MKNILVLCFGLLIATPVCAQVRNPIGVTFSEIDHANPEVMAYEIDIVRPDGTVAQTIIVPKSATSVLSAAEAAALGNGAVAGDIKVNLNVQPVAFGSYTLTIRAQAGLTKSDNSPSSDVWQRTPGQPSKGRPF